MKIKVKNSPRYKRILKAREEKKWDEWTTQDHADFCKDIVSDLMKRIKK